MNTLLSEKIARKAKKPEFVGQDFRKRKKIDRRWRKPKGGDSKVLHHLRGRRRSPSIGWGSPRKVKDLWKSGHTINVVATIKEMDSLDPKKDGIVISRTVGKRRRVELIEHAQKKGLTILNIKKPSEYVSAVKSEIDGKRKVKEATSKKKEEKPKVEEKKEEEAPKDQLQEKKEIDKVLTQKG